MIAALNKFWRPVSEDYYYNKMDSVAINNAITVSGMNDEVFEWIWEKEKPVFGMVEKGTRTYNR